MTLAERDPLATDPETERKQFVPPSLLRVRRFLFEQGMRIVPWATASQVLDEFHELLEQREGDGAFWSSVGELLTALQVDLSERMDGNAQENEILTTADREQLLQDIRSHLKIHSRSREGGFRSLTQSLPQSCQTLLLLLASAVVVSCGARSDFTSANESSTGGHHGTGGRSATGGGQNTIGTGGTYSCPSTSVDAGINVRSMGDVQSIAVECIPAGAARDSVLACLSTLNASWQQGIEGLLNCVDCESAAYYLNLLAQICDTLPPQYADTCYFHDCGIYIGARLD